MSSENTSARIITPADAIAAAVKINNDKVITEGKLREYVKQIFVTEKDKIIEHINSNIIYQLANGEKLIEFNTYIRSPHYVYDLYKYDSIGMERIDKTITDQLDKECKVFGEFIKAAGYSTKVSATGYKDKVNYPHRYGMYCNFTLDLN